MSAQAIAAVVRAPFEATVFLDPNKLNEADPAEVLDEAAHGRLGLDHRFLHALLDRREKAFPTLLEFAGRDRSNDTVDLAPELIAIFRLWNTPEALPFYISYIKEDRQDIPDEITEGLVAIGRPALEPLLELYTELDESESGDVAFILAHVGIRDERILKLLLDRLEYDLWDTALLLGAYGDPAAKSALQAAMADLTDSDADVKADVEQAIADLDKARPTTAEESSDFDIWALYPEEADLPVDLLGEETRLALLEHPLAAVRVAAAASFFNRQLASNERDALLKLAKEDQSSQVRARAWEALMTVSDDTDVVEAMLAALRHADLDPEERGGLTVGLSAEVDRNEVRKAILDFYEKPEGRAKAMEAMWRSVHPSFRDYFAKHLNDADVEVRRAAIWGVGYYGLRAELEHLRKFFDDEELRSDALFAYAMAIPADLSPGRVKGVLARIEKDARGLSEGEEELVKTALDERLMMAGKEPVFIEQED